MSAEMTTSEALRIARGFNDMFVVGTPVRYWTGAREGTGVLSHTRTPADVLGGHTPMVWVDGHAACIALTHVECVTQARRRP